MNVDPHRGSGSLSQSGRVCDQLVELGEDPRLHRAEEMPIRAIARKLGISPGGGR